MLNVCRNTYLFFLVIRKYRAKLTLHSNLISSSSPFNESIVWFRRLLSALVGLEVGGMKTGGRGRVLRVITHVEY